jgi:nucleotide-binding universal stress UspA family protein
MAENRARLRRVGEIMLPFRKILCPTDFSDISYQALDAAIQLAKDFHAELCVLHVAPPLGSELGVAAYGAAGYAPVIPSDAAELDEESVSDAKARLSELIAARVPEGVKARGLVHLGNAASEIESAIEAENADLLVIATRGLSGWRHLVFGSVTERTVRLAKCPVLAFHDRRAHKRESRKEPLLPLRQILCPTDFSEPSRVALQAAGELAAHYGAKLGVLHVTWTLANRLPSGDYEMAGYDKLKVCEAHAKLGEMIRENTPAAAGVYPLVRPGAKAEEIERAAEEEEADLIVIATHGASGWQRLFYGSIAEQVLRTTHFPILVIHAPATIEK